jgi:hypothetical protein
MNQILARHRGDIIFTSPNTADTLGRTFAGADVVVGPVGTVTQVIVHNRLDGVRIKRAILRRLRGQFVAVSERQSRAL